MDNHQRSRSISAIKRLILILSGISVLYIGVFRPIQSMIIQNIVVPHIESIIENNSIVKIENVDVDQIDISGDFPPTKFELPFNGWFWLTLGLFLAAGQERLIRIMTYYHLILFGALYVGIQLIINGWTGIAYLFAIHEHIYKVLFLVVGLIGLKPLFKK
ncbi:MAG: hypothetical protein HOD10_00440 [Candidatus Marinimicrobia bacterium]|nr:hypothetical protein [Candidatus Neomarinimicrobiota bacterium]MBT4270102.1 hypothetical protein [Candidatus Neomarinimicrobiota bacterium]MBT4371246.1 hypothetical protein [Candidatus Neomarinimicrobiota bacterium]